MAISGTYAYVAAKEAGLQILPTQCESSHVREGFDGASALRLQITPRAGSLEAAAIRFHLPAKGRVQATIYDVAGRQVRLLCDRTLVAGTQELIWDGQDSRGASVSAGVYLVRVSTDVQVAPGRLVILR